MTLALPEGRMLYRLMASATPSRDDPFGGDESAGLALATKSCSSVLALLHRHNADVVYKLRSAQHGNDTALERCSTL